MNSELRIWSDLNSQLLKFPFQYLMNVLKTIRDPITIILKFLLCSLRQTRTADLYIISVAL